jgi:hypothetical protein
MPIRSSKNQGSWIFRQSDKSDFHPMNISRFSSSLWRFLNDWKLVGSRLEPWHHDRDLALESAVVSVGLDVRKFTAMVMKFEPWEVDAAGSWDRRKKNIFLCLATQFPEGHGRWVWTAGWKTPGSLKSSTYSGRMTTHFGWCQALPCGFPQMFTCWWLCRSYAQWPQNGSKESLQLDPQIHHQRTLPRD